MESMACMRTRMGMCLCVLACWRAGVCDIFHLHGTNTQKKKTRRCFLQGRRLCGCSGCGVCLCVVAWLLSLEVLASAAAIFHCSVLIFFIRVFATIALQNYQLLRRQRQRTRELQSFTFAQCRAHTNNTLCLSYDAAAAAAGCWSLVLAGLRVAST